LAVDVATNEKQEKPHWREDIQKLVIVVSISPTLLLYMANHEVVSSPRILETIMIMPYGEHQHPF